MLTPLKSAVKKAITMTGYRIVRLDTNTTKDGNYDPYSKTPTQTRNIVDLSVVANISATIPGMITPLSGQLIYSLCYFQNEPGDVVEIGSWQGRSASFLARATAESQNGSFFAIDHFKGNPGKEHYYVVKEEDLSDLKSGFVANINRVGLSDVVNLMDMPNDEAVTQLANRKIRFLLIDGDHSGPGVQKDIDLFFPLLVDGAIVVFDDYSRRFPGLIDAIDRLLAQGKHSKYMIYANSFVLKYRTTPE